MIHASEPPHEGFGLRRFVGFGFLVLVSGFRLRGLGSRFRVPPNQHPRYASEPPHEGLGFRLFLRFGLLFLVSGSSCGVWGVDSGFLKISISAMFQNHLMKVLGLDVSWDLDFWSWFRVWGSGSGFLKISIPATLQNHLMTVCLPLEAAQALL